MISGIFLMIEQRHYHMDVKMFRLNKKKTKKINKIVLTTIGKENNKSLRFLLTILKTKNLKV